MDVLVLSKTWEPMDRISWEDAFTVLFGGKDDRKAEVVEYHAARTVRSGSPGGELREWKVPSVIRFVNAMVPQVKNVRFSRENIYLRDRGCCQYCGLHVAPDDWEYEHVVPRAKGGRTTWENIVVACTACNQRKASKTPAQAGMRLLAKPAKPEKLFRRRAILSWRHGMPEAWRSYMRDATYWNGELEQA
jgi:5-methylcytosine-specific restriction endonuclease McrA